MTLKSESAPQRRARGPLCPICQTQMYGLPTLRVFGMDERVHSRCFTAAREIAARLESARDSYEGRHRE